MWKQQCTSLPMLLRDKTAEVYDFSLLEIGHSILNDFYWSESYRDAMEAIPVHAPKPQRNEVDINMFVDIDHAWDKLSCRSRSGSLIHVNTALVPWFLA